MSRDKEGSEILSSCEAIFTWSWINKNHQCPRVVPDSVLQIAQSSGVETPALLHVGKLDAHLLDQVRACTLPGMTFEVVIGKTPQARASQPAVMFKYKSQAWYDRLRDLCAGDQAMFDRLA